MARPKGIYKFEPAQIQDAWEMYKNKCDSNVDEEVSAGKVVKVKKPLIYTLEEFLIFLGLSPQAWDEYEDTDRFGETVSRIKAEVFARKKGALVNGKGSTQGLMFDMRANYGITDKQIVDATVAATVTQVTPQVIAAPIPVATSEREVDV